MRTIVVFIMLASLAGCGGGDDPCAGLTGACISAHIVGTAIQLDQLAITVDQPAMETVRTPNPAASFTLPVNVALLLQPGASGTVSVAIDGFSSGDVVAHTAMPVVLPASGRASATFHLDAGSATDGSAGDGSTGDGFMSPDMACSGAIACVAGDGCCPVGCTTATDSDCKPAVCGNNIVENGEACDDGNSVNGDGCDPTCHYTNTVDTVSGIPGNILGYFDGTGATTRLAQPQGVALATPNLYVADRNNRALRQININTGVATTLFGHMTSDPSPPVDGNFTSATAHVLGDVAVVGTSVYFIDDTKLRQADLTAKTVNTLVDLGANAWQIVGLGSDGGTLLILDGNGLRSMTPPSTTLTTIVSQTTLAALGGGCHRAATYTNTTTSVKHYFLACTSTVVDVVNGTASIFAGSTTASGCADLTTANSTFKSAYSVAVTMATPPMLYVSDTGCANVRAIPLEGANANMVSLYAGCTVSCAANSPTPRLQANFIGPGFLEATYGISGQMLFLVEGNGIIQIPATGNITPLAGSWGGMSIGGSSFGTSTGSLYTGTSGLVSDGVDIFANDSRSAVAFTVNLATGASQQIPNASWGNARGLGGTGITKMGNTLYISVDDGTIRSLGTDGSNATIFAGTMRTVGTAAAPMDGPRATAIMSPGAITNDGTNLYFVDSNTIRRIDASGMVKTLVGVANTTDIMDGVGVAAHFANATALTYDGTNLYVIDGANSTEIRRITLPGLVVGPGPFAGDPTAAGLADGIGSAARFAGASGLATDGQILLVTDPGPSSGGFLPNGPTIREIVIATGAVTTMIGTGGAWSLRDGVGTTAIVNSPTDITFDAPTHSFFFFDFEGVFQRIH